MNIITIQDLLNFLARKDVSEVVRNYLETAALAGGTFAFFKWRRERSDRATEVLFRIEKEFGAAAIRRGKELVDDERLYDRYQAAIASAVRQRKGDAHTADLDALLRFYLILYGILGANQLPKRSLSICFQYWLAHYYRNDRIEFHDYVDTFYPTLKKWLAKDCQSPKSEKNWIRGKWFRPFFHPAESFPKEKLNCSATKRSDTQASLTTSALSNPF